MPGIVPHTSTYALTNATLSYAPRDRRPGPAARRCAASAALRRACNVLDGHVTHPAVAAAVGVDVTPPDVLLAES